MFSYLERLRKRDGKFRRRVALSISLIVTSVIFLSWLGVGVFYPESTSRSGSGSAPSPAVSLKNSISSSWSSLSSDIKSVYDNIFKSFDDSLDWDSDEEYEDDYLEKTDNPVTNIPPRPRDVPEFPSQ